MYTAILSLALIWATVFTAAAIGDQAEIISARNVAAIRAEQTADAYLTSCGDGVCDSALVAAAPDDAAGTRIEVCLSGTGVLVVTATIPLEPRLFISLNEAAARVAETLPAGSDTPGVAACPV